ncbi:acyltransferase [Actinoplanes sp. SE50]|uniref:acyltransferase family protein n=1 Tax=unclassified Actinoplanes TaxID=2626549 RepID=UPI00023EC7B0|nr:MULTISPECIES: acyltransferase [unclassified Actinoplanes]AEV84214.1 Putative peptidoglycan O-acetyltransferase yrhL [Actinoplanes sp. SE50/110]ATO82606.1 acyltransferase [Actinoplanes sp. SE50]SLM00013.1 acyltransferase [Actinoplanes sp. SE50/110]
MTTATLDRTAVRGDSAPGPKGRPRLYVLDAMRLVCALAVAGYHFGDSWWADGTHRPAYFLPHAAPVLIYGFLGVEVFFLISGFVILMSGWGRTVRAFAASRAARLYPALWAGVLITALVSTLLPIEGGLPLGPLPAGRDVLVNLTMLAEPLNRPLVDTVYWTLWCEFRFYLIVACMLAAGLTAKRVRLLGAGWLTAAMLMPAFPGAVLNQVVMADFAPYFVAGMTMFLLRRDRRDWWAWLLLAVCWLVSLHHVQLRVADLRPGFDVAAWPAPVLLTMAYGVLLVIALGGTDRITWRWLGTAGALTYPFYLVHQRVGYSLIRTARTATGLPVPTLIVGAVLVLLTTAWLIHRLTERPLAPYVRALLAGPRSLPGPGRVGHDTDPRDDTRRKSGLTTM